MCFFFGIPPLEELQDPDGSPVEDLTINNNTTRNRVRTRRGLPRTTKNTTRPSDNKTLGKEVVRKHRRKGGFVPMILLAGAQSQRGEVDARVARRWGEVDARVADRGRRGNHLNDPRRGPGPGTQGGKIITATPLRLLTRVSIKFDLLEELLL